MAIAKSVSFSFEFGQIRMSQNILIEMGRPRFIKFLLNMEEKKVVIVPIAKKDLNCVEINYNLKGIRYGFRVYSKLLVEKIYAVFDWDMGVVYKAEAIPGEDERTFIVDLSKAKTAQR